MEDEHQRIIKELEKAISLALPNGYPKYRACDPIPTHLLFYEKSTSVKDDSK